LSGKRPKVNILDIPKDFALLNSILKPIPQIKDYGSSCRQKRIETITQIVISKRIRADG
jgi:hypothetical protein